MDLIAVFETVPEHHMVKFAKSLVRTAFVLAAAAGLLCTAVPAPAFAQAAASGVAGVVMDSSGAALPGVTVEAASPRADRKGAHGGH